MASKRMIARDKQLIRKFSDQTARNKLKEILSDNDSSVEKVMQAMMDLQKRSVDESPIRRVRRCNSCGRPKGVYRRFSLCRMCIRKFASLGYLPGLVKSSW